MSGCFKIRLKRYGYPTAIFFNVKGRVEISRELVSSGEECVFLVQVLQNPTSGKVYFAIV